MSKAPTPNHFTSTDLWSSGVNTQRSWLWSTYSVPLVLLLRWNTFWDTQPSQVHTGHIWYTLDKTGAVNRHRCTSKYCKYEMRPRIFQKYGQVRLLRNNFVSWSTGGERTVSYHANEWSQALSPSVRVRFMFLVLSQLLKTFRWKNVATAVPERSVCSGGSHLGQIQWGHLVSELMKWLFNVGAVSMVRLDTVCGSGAIT